MFYLFKAFFVSLRFPFLLFKGKRIPDFYQKENCEWLTIHTAEEQLTTYFNFPSFSISLPLRTIRDKKIIFIEVLYRKLVRQVSRCVTNIQAPYFSHKTTYDAFFVNATVNFLYNVYNYLHYWMKNTMSNPCVSWVSGVLTLA